VSKFQIGDWVLITSNRKSGIYKDCIGKLMQVVLISKIRQTYLYDLKHKYDKIAYGCAYEEELAEPTELIKALM
jgi:hypothetical protein